MEELVGLYLQGDGCYLVGGLPGVIIEDLRQRKASLSQSRHQPRALMFSGHDNEKATSQKDNGRSAESSVTRWH